MSRCKEVGSLFCAQKTIINYNATTFDNLEKKIDLKRSGPEIYAMVKTHQFTR
jgi:hypothetical protein